MVKAPGRVLRIPTDLQAAQAPVPSVNVSEGPSVHRAGSRHLQHSSKPNGLHAALAADVGDRFAAPSPHLGPREEASEAEDVTAAVGHGELAGGQDAQTYGTSLRLLAVWPIGQTLAT